MNFGPSDIAAGVRLALRIYEYGFAEENRADVRYANFRNDVKNFRYLLKKLEEALQAAQDRYEARGPTFGNPPHEPLSDELEDERKVIVGDFYATLRECEALLNKNKDLRLRHSNVLENLKYNLTQQEKCVDDLRRRLHFHSEKIRFVLDRLSIRLLTDIDAKIDDLRAVVDENLQLSQNILEEVVQFRSSLFGYLSGHGRLQSSPTSDCHRASDDIGAKFWTNLFVNAPPAIDSSIPIAEGFDVLLLYFEQSAEGSDHTPEKYLLFLKARWIYDRLKESREYEDARPGFYYKRAINQIGQAIIAKTRQPGKLVQYDEAILRSLPDSYFLIWPDPVTKKSVRNDQASLLMVRANEQKAAYIEFSSDGQSEADSITVFRSAQDRFRIVHKTSRESESGKAINNDMVPQKVHCLKDRLIPRYALPTLNEPNLEIAILSDDEEMLYQFDSMQNLRKFQAAMTGYEIPYDCERVQCQFSQRVGFLDCTGRIQVWQEPIGLARPAAESSHVRHSSSRKPSSLSHSSHSRYDSLAPSLLSTNTIQKTNGGWQADKIKSSAIVIYTQLHGKNGKGELAIIFIELEEEIRINKSLCKCFDNYNECSNVVLTTLNENGFVVRVLKSDSDLVRRTPNPNTFDIFPLRLPRHPGFARTTLVKTESLVLKFGTLSSKQHFDNELRTTARVRDAQEDDKRHFEREVRYLADRPQRGQEFVQGQASVWSSSSHSNDIFVPGRREEDIDAANDDSSTLKPETSSSRAKTEKRKGFLGFGKKGKK